jgi:glycosyltransferase involved in cell wall biosynthesis
VHLLRTAVDSVLRQTYEPLELVVSDNASTDGTEEFCRALAAREPRLRYVRQASNVGLTANYAAVRAAATGAYYMALGDDDHPDPNYVAECVAALESDPSLVVAAGRPFMCRGDVQVREAVRTDLLDESPERRVLAYYRSVEENASFNGVVRRSAIAAVPPMRNTMGGDWLYMASVAWLGRIRTLDATAIRKQVGGTSRSTISMARQMGMPFVQGLLPAESITVSAFIEVAWRSPVFAPLGALRRWLFAFRVSGALFWRFRVRGFPGMVRRMARRLTPGRGPA